MTTLDIVLIDPKGPQLHIPVNPSEITIQREKDIETITILNRGEVDFPSGEKVKQITFSSFFPKEYDGQYCRYPEIPDPQEAMNQLTAWNASKTPVRLIITDTIINAMVLVTAHTSKFKGGEPGDVYFDLTCRVWREVKVRTAAESVIQSEQLDAQNIAAIERPDTRPVPSTVVIKPGDTLWTIAKLQLGDGGRWRDIYQLNKDAIGPDPGIIQSGVELVMPA
ncbi:LysM peptidoglycan-binding domain-containing protein [Heliobacterium mobile]|uniref:LysM peptidoglycan-binding domain-containing protein n=1 Tax=Heliobacterium mobile TaxID=28064 RepID=UPI002E257547